MIIDEISRTAVTQECTDFGEFLVVQGALSKQELNRAEQYVHKQGQTLQTTLLDLNILSEQSITEALGKFYNAPMVSIDKYPTAPLLHSNHFSPEFFQHAQVLPIYVEEDQVVLAMADPSDQSVIHAVQVACGKRVLPRAGLPSEIKQVQAHIYGKRDTGQRSQNTKQQQSTGSIKLQVPAVANENEVDVQMAQAKTMRAVSQSQQHGRAGEQRRVTLQPPSVISRSFVVLLLVAITVVSALLMFAAKMLVDLLHIA